MLLKAPTHWKLVSSWDVTLLGGFGARCHFRGHWLLKTSCVPAQCSSTSSSLSSFFSKIIALVLTELLISNISLKYKFPNSVYFLSLTGIFCICPSSWPLPNPPLLQGLPWTFPYSFHHTWVLPYSGLPVCAVHFHLCMLSVVLFLGFRVYTRLLHAV